MTARVDCLKRCRGVMGRIDTDSSIANHLALFLKKGYFEV